MTLGGTELAAVAPLKQQRIRLDSLTGLRFYAAILVVLDHATHIFLPSAFSEFFAMGSVGVSFFFILSGFVLTWSRKDDQRPGAFYRNRFARIYPLHLLTWIVAGALMVLAGGSPDVSVALATLVLVQAWIPVDRYFFGMNGPSWSLSCEAFFYAVFPFLAPRVARLGARSLWKLIVWGYVAVGLLTLVLHVALKDGPSVAILYVNPLYRLWEFVVGIALAQLVKGGWRPWLSVRTASALSLASFAAAGLLNVAIVEGWAHLGPIHMRALPSDLASLMTVPFLALLIAAGARSDLDRRPSHFRSPALVNLGTWSFALYISHLLLLNGVRQMLPAAVNVPAAAAAAMLSVAAAVALSPLLYRFVEHPLEARLRSSERPKRAALLGSKSGSSSLGGSVSSRIQAIAVIAAAVVVAVVIGAWVLVIEPQQRKAEFDRAQAANAELVKPSATTATATAGPAGLKSARQIKDTINGQNVSLLLPPNPNGDLVIAAHGHGGNVTEWSSGQEQSDMLGALIDAGYSIAASDAHGDAWGNAQSVTDYKDLRAWAETKGVFQSTVLLGQSMGGLAALQLLTTVSDARAFVGIYPVCDLSTVSQRFADTAKAWPNGTTGHLSPVNLSNVSGKKLIFFSSPADTVVPKATNTDKCAAAAKAAGADVSVIEVRGDHGDPSAFRPKDVIDFLSGS